MLQLSMLQIWQEHETSWFWFLFFTGNFCGKWELKSNSWTRMKLELIVLKYVITNWFGYLLTLVLLMQFFLQIEAGCGYFKISLSNFQGTVYFFLAFGALLNCIAFIVSRRNCFLYLAAAFSITIGTYLGFFRMQIKKKFNIKVSYFFPLSMCLISYWRIMWQVILSFFCF